MNTDLPTPSELASVAASLAGPCASNDEIVGKFAQASLLLLSAETWLLDQSRRETEITAYILDLAKSADAKDPILPWTDERLLEFAGYGISSQRGRDQNERAQKLWDTVRKQVERKWGKTTSDLLREKYRSGIELSRFKQLWPTLSQWRNQEAPGNPTA